jgi:excisionase family DNA binding protein
MSAVSPSDHQEVKAMSSILERYMTIEEAAQVLGRTRDSLYTATKRGKLRPIRIKRRNFFDRAEVAAFATASTRPNPTKAEAAALHARYPQPPTTDAGTPLMPETTWSIFTAYASDPAATFETVGEQFHVTRQRIQQHVARAIERLTELDAL